MARSSRFCTAAAAIFLVAAIPSSAAPLVWAHEPAQKWGDAFPVGNGRIGGMVFGGVARERIQLNEDTIWNGRKRDRDNPEALRSLPAIRRLLFAGKPLEATALAEKTLMGIPNRQPPYQPLGDLLIVFPGHENPAGYRRELDLKSGIARTTYRIGEEAYTREVFSSAPDQVLVVRIVCDKPGKLSFRATLARERDARTSVAPPDRVILEGEAIAHTNFWIRPDQTPERMASEKAQLEATGVKFRGVLRVSADGGKVSVSGSEVVVSGANAATLLLAASTDYRGGEPAACERYLARASKPFSALRAAHAADHEKLFGRVQVEIRGPNQAALDALPTPERLERVRQGAEDPGLAALYYQFGRYLLMGSSRPGTMAANLQGIWNGELAPPWDSKYTININIQMNYWTAEPGNLSECHLPVFDLIKLSLANGRRTAKAMYGARGFVFHHNLDAWGDTAPVDYAYCGTWPMGGAWMALHYWEHYLFGLDREFLAREGYPVMKEAAEFLLDFLVDDGKGHLVTNPSHSPENSYRMPDGTVAHLTVGAAMDYEITHALFTASIRAAEVLGTDSAFAAQLAAALKRIPELRTGKHGQLMEWSEDYDEPQPGMGHVSHLFALYPGNQITVRGTPGLARGARVSLERRMANGAGRGGWPCAWFVSLWARLEDGELAWRHVRTLLASRSTAASLLNAGGQFFQIDANFGGAAGIAEMLLQSHAGEIAILPALPAAWPEGRFEGMRARGNVEVSAEWRAGRAVWAQLRAATRGEQRLRPPRGQKITAVRCGGRSVAVKPGADGAWRAALEPGQSCVVAFE